MADEFDFKPPQFWRPYIQPMISNICLFYTLEFGVRSWLCVRKRVKQYNGHRQMTRRKSHSYIEWINIIDIDSGTNIQKCVLMRPKLIHFNCDKNSEKLIVEWLKLKNELFYICLEIHNLNKKKKKMIYRTENGVDQSILVTLCGGSNFIGNLFYYYWMNKIDQIVAVYSEVKNKKTKWKLLLSCMCEHVQKKMEKQNPDQDLRARFLN